MRLSRDSVTMKNALEVKKEGYAALQGGDAQIDFSTVREVDSSAVSVLLSWMRYAKEKGLTLEVCHVPHALVSLLTLYGILPLFAKNIRDED